MTESTPWRTIESNSVSNGTMSAIIPEVLFFGPAVPSDRGGSRYIVNGAAPRVCGAVPLLQPPGDERDNSGHDDRRSPVERSDDRADVGRRHRDARVEDLHVGDAPAGQRHDPRRDIDMRLGFRGVQLEGANVEAELIVGHRGAAGERSGEPRVLEGLDETGAKQR